MHCDVLVMPCTVMLLVGKWCMLVTTVTSGEPGSCWPPQPRTWPHLEQLPHWASNTGELCNAVNLSVRSALGCMWRLEILRHRHMEPLRRDRLTHDVTTYPDHGVSAENIRFKRNEWGSNRLEAHLGDAMRHLGPT
jgi:hypothetical protein